MARLLTDEARHRERRFFQEWNRHGIEVKEHGTQCLCGAIIRMDRSADDRRMRCEGCDQVILEITYRNPEVPRKPGPPAWFKSPRRQP